MKDSKAASMAAPVSAVASDIICAIGRRDEFTYVPEWYSWWTRAT